jgi:D-3-phosphoglycerate dehydrogenase / 2-oxoglutarate reductase
MKKILTSPSSFGKISSEPLDILESNGYTVINNPYGRKLTEREVVDLAKDCVGIVAGVENISVEVINALSNLKCISRVGVGMDSIDLDYAKKNNIKVLNTPDGPTRSVAEFTLAMALSLIRKIPFAHVNIKSNIWKKETGSLFLGKTLGVIGLGRIGKKVSQLFQAIGLKIISYDTYPDEKWAKENNVKLVSFDSVVSDSDILSIHVPGSNSEPLLKIENLSTMKKDSLLINISRGGVVDETALYEVLKNNKIAGAAIDVFSNEPYNGKLIELDNVILTPHIGSYAKEGKLKMEIDAVKNIIKYLNY